MRNCIFVWKDDLGQDEAVPAARYISSATCRGCCDFGYRSWHWWWIDGGSAHIGCGLYPISTLGRCNHCAYPDRSKTWLVLHWWSFLDVFGEATARQFAPHHWNGANSSKSESCWIPRSEIRFLQSFGEDMQMVEVLKHHSCPDWSDRDHYFSYGPPMGKGLAYVG